MSKKGCVVASVAGLVCLPVWACLIVLVSYLFHIPLAIAAVGTVLVAGIGMLLVVYKV